MTKQEAIKYCEEKIKNSPLTQLMTIHRKYHALLGLINGGLVDAGIQGYDKRKRFIVYGPEDYETREGEVLTGGDVEEDFAKLKALCSEVGELVTKTPTSTHWWILKLDKE